MTRTPPKAFGFDVFGTVVDWRSGIIRASAGFLERIDRVDTDSAAFADAWRRQYLATMRDYRSSGRPFVPLDVLHREMLEAALRGIGVDPFGLDDALLADWTRAWHRLDPWSDAVGGIARLRTRFRVVTLTNGNVALMLAMARRAGLVWDALLGAEVTQAYKRDSAAYRDTAAILQLDPSDLCLVASHHADLAAARACGLATAYVDRPQEFGGAPAPDAGDAQDWDWRCDDLEELAGQFGC